MARKPKTICVDGINSTYAEVAVRFNTTVKAVQSYIYKHGSLKGFDKRHEKDFNAITWRGISKTYREWAEELGITESAVRHRWNRHKSLDEKALSRNSPNTKVTYLGRKHTLKEWATILGMGIDTLKSRWYSYGRLDTEKVWVGKRERRNSAARVRWAKRMSNINKKEFNRLRAEQNTKRKTPEEWKEYDHNQYLKSREKRIARAKEYRKNHIDECRARDCVYSAEKYARKEAMWRIDAESYAKHREQVRIKKALKRVRSGNLYRPLPSRRLPDYLCKGAPFCPDERLLTPYPYYLKNLES